MAWTSKFPITGLDGLAVFGPPSGLRLNGNFVDADADADDVKDEDSPPAFDSGEIGELPLPRAVLLELQSLWPKKAGSPRSVSTPAPRLHCAAMAKAGLMPHEKKLLESQELVEVSHKGASSILLEAPLLGFQAPAEDEEDGLEVPKEEDEDLETEEMVSVYRHMTDMEAGYLLEHSILPDTQPYQTIVVGEEGYEYCKKYFTGKKKVTPPVTTIVEFQCPKTLVEELFAMQWKIEDGARSHGLGDKGGKGLPLFNDSLRSSSTSWRVVFVKRPRR
eukprot:s104_g22.t1